MIEQVIRIFTGMQTFPLWPEVISFCCFVCVVGIVLQGVGKNVRT